MLNAAFTDEIFQYLARSHTIKTDDFYRALHHELIPMIIALLPKLGHIIYKRNSAFETIKHTAFEALEVTDLPYLRTLEIDDDMSSILERAPHLAQVDFLTPPSWNPFERARDSFGGVSKIRTLPLRDIAVSLALDRSLSFAGKDLRSLVIEACTTSLKRFR